MKRSRIFAWTCIFLFTYICTLFWASAVWASEPRGPEAVVELTTPPARSASVDNQIKLDKKIKQPVKNKQWTAKTKVWLARSCVGESGFAAIDECMAIAWIYAKRSRMVGWSLLKMIRKYSAATKPHEVHRRPWLFELTLDGKKPEHWPGALSWRRHKVIWMRLLAELDKWQRGEVPDVMPEADHYGSYRDANQSYRVRTWERLAPPEGFKNLYFNSRSRHNRVVDKYTRYMINGRY